MRYFFDTEFIEDGKTIELLSIGMVAEDGRELYLENVEADWSRASDWVRENVLVHLKPYTLWPARPPHASRARIATDVSKFCDPTTYGKPEFWGYYADYDWVVLCQLFGTMMELPKGWPMYCRDIKQWADMLGDTHLPEQGKGEHHALADAKWNRSSWEYLYHIDLLRRTL